MRLIDADALTDYLSKADTETLFSISDFVEAIRNAPTVPGEYPHAKTRAELLEADWNSLTDEEKERRARAKAIPEAVVEACWEKYHSLQSEMQEAEGKMDAILDYVNGYNTGGNI